MKTTLQVRAPVRYELMLNCSMQAVNIRKKYMQKIHTHTHRYEYGIYKNKAVRNKYVERHKLELWSRFFSIKQKHALN